MEARDTVKLSHSLTPMQRVEQPAHRLTWALIAALNYIALGCDVGNAFAEADAPAEGFSMEIDEAFRDWWVNHLQRPPIPLGWVVPILKNLQGHPEAPRLWSKHITNLIIDKLHFTPTTHEPCLYFKHEPNGNIILLLRQVDDFLIAASTMDTCQAIRQEIQKHMANPLNDLGIIKRFNGIDIQQTQQFITLHCATYIEHIV